MSGIEHLLDTLMPFTQQYYERLLKLKVRQERFVTAIESIRKNIQRRKIINRKSKIFTFEKTETSLAGYYHSKYQLISSTVDSIRHYHSYVTQIESRKYISAQLKRIYSQVKDNAFYHALFESLPTIPKRKQLDFSTNPFDSTKLSFDNAFHDFYFELPKIHHSTISFELTESQKVSLLLADNDCIDSLRIFNSYELSGLDAIPCVILMAQKNLYFLQKTTYIQNSVDKFFPTDKPLFPYSRNTNTSGIRLKFFEESNAYLFQKSEVDSFFSEIDLEFPTEFCAFSSAHDEKSEILSVTKSSDFGGTNKDFNRTKPMKRNDWSNYLSVISYREIGGSIQRKFRSEDVCVELFPANQISTRNDFLLSGHSGFGLQKNCQKLLMFSSEQVRNSFHKSVLYSIRATQALFYTSPAINQQTDLPDSDFLRNPIEEEEKKKSAQLRISQKSMEKFYLYSLHDLRKSDHMEEKGLESNLILDPFPGLQYFEYGHFLSDSSLSDESSAESDPYVGDFQIVSKRKREKLSNQRRRQRHMDIQIFHEKRIEGNLDLDKIRGIRRKSQTPSPRRRSSHKTSVFEDTDSDIDSMASEPSRREKRRNRKFSVHAQKKPTEFTCSVYRTEAVFVPPIDGSESYVLSEQVADLSTSQITTPKEIQEVQASDHDESFRSLMDKFSDSRRKLEQKDGILDVFQTKQFVRSYFNYAQFSSLQMLTDFSAKNVAFDKLSTDYNTYSYPYSLRENLANLSKFAQHYLINRQNPEILYLNSNVFPSIFSHTTGLPFESIMWIFGSVKDGKFQNSYHQSIQNFVGNNFPYTDSSEIYLNQAHLLLENKELNKKPRNSWEMLMQDPIVLTTPEPVKTFTEYLSHYSTGIYSRTDPNFFMNSSHTGYYYPLYLSRYLKNLISPVVTSGTSILSSDTILQQIFDLFLRNSIPLLSFGDSKPQVQNIHQISSSKEFIAEFFEETKALSKRAMRTYNNIHKIILSSVTTLWRNDRITNFNYLMLLNFASGRSFQDLTQYPVFPWILSDYTSKTIDLTSPNSFRDLSKPMGALDEKRAKTFVERYDLLSKEGDAFHYGSHYSSSAIVLYYLIRLEPFTRLQLQLQGGYFDHADRLFSSVPRAFELASCAGGLADVKELIPQFFYLPDFLVNSNQFNFGKLQNSALSLDNVELPPWASNDPVKFIEIQRRALESDYVSVNLHHWIDLIWGYKQQGKEAEKAVNVFYYLTYQNADLQFSNQSEKESLLSQIENFGQTPVQLFNKPHPKKKLAKVNIRMYKQQTDENKEPDSPSFSSSEDLDAQIQDQQGKIRLSVYSNPTLLFPRLIRHMDSKGVIRYAHGKDSQVFLQQTNGKISSYNLTTKKEATTSCVSLSDLYSPIVSDIQYLPMAEDNHIFDKNVDSWHSSSSFTKTKHLNNSLSGMINKFMSYDSTPSELLQQHVSSRDGFKTLLNEGAKFKKKFDSANESRRRIVVSYGKSILLPPFYDCQIVYGLDTGSLLITQTPQYNSNDKIQGFVVGNPKKQVLGISSNAGTSGTFGTCAGPISHIQKLQNSTHVAQGVDKLTSLSKIQSAVSQYVVGFEGDINVSKLVGALDQTVLLKESRKALITRVSTEIELYARNRATATNSKISLEKFPKYSIIQDQKPMEILTPVDMLIHNFKKSGHYYSHFEDCCDILTELRSILVEKCSAPPKVVRKFTLSTAIKKIGFSSKKSEEVKQDIQEQREYSKKLKDLDKQLRLRVPNPNTVLIRKKFDIKAYLPHEFESSVEQKNFDLKIVKKKRGSKSSPTIDAFPSDKLLKPNVLGIYDMLHPTGTISCVGYSPTSEIIVTGGTDCTVRFWALRKPSHDNCSSAISMFDQHVQPNTTYSLQRSRRTLSQASEMPPKKSNFTNINYGTNDGMNKLDASIIDRKIPTKLEALGCLSVHSHPIKQLLISEKHSICVTIDTFGNCYAFDLFRMVMIMKFDFRNQFSTKDFIYRDIEPVIEEKESSVFGCIDESSQTIFLSRGNDLYSFGLNRPQYITKYTSETTEKITALELCAKQKFTDHSVLICGHHNGSVKFVGYKLKDLEDKHDVNLDLYTYTESKQPSDSIFQFVDIPGVQRATSFPVTKIFTSHYNYYKFWIGDSRGNLIEYSMSTKNDHWVPDVTTPKCQQVDCPNVFSMSMRKHHCRCCGKIFCKSCSPHNMYLPDLGYESKVRVCQTCYTKRTS